MSEPLVAINMRAASRRRLSGVERWSREVADRLCLKCPERYRPLAPPPLLRDHPIGQLWEQLALPVSAARLSAAFILSPANLVPIAWPRNVLVLHDAAVLRRPEAYTRAYRAWHRRIELTGARRAAALITVSEFSRREIAELAGIDPARIVVAGGGVGSAFWPGADTERATRRHGLSRPYVLTVATGDRRKNLGALAPAAAELAGAGLELVRVGGTRRQFAPEPGAGGIRELGYVPDRELPGLYAGARAFVIASSYEGWGLPCLEAMACGTPVVAADRGGLPEACGGAALLIDPDESDALTSAVLAAATDAGTREPLIDAGLRRAAQASWEAVADRVDGVLDALLSDTSSPPASTGA